MRRRSVVALALVFVMALSLVLVGCTAQRRPAPNGGTTPQTPSAPNTPGEAVRDMAASISSAITGMNIPGVRAVNTVVLSNVAIVGLDMTGGTTGTGNGTTGTTGTGGAAGTGTTGTTGATGTGTAGTTGATGTTGTTGTRGTTGTGGAAPGAGGTTGAGGAGGGAQTTYRTVADRVRTMFPQVIQVYVTSDPTQVAQLGTISGDVRRGVPITNHMDKLSALLKKLTPVVAPGTTTPGTTTGGGATGTNTGGTTGGTTSGATTTGR